MIRDYLPCLLPITVRGFATIDRLMHSDEAIPSDHDFPSGKWTGYYLEGGCRFKQELHLTFADTHLRGSGGDTIGEFTIRGSYDLETKDVWWTKHYIGGHDVFYRGYREARGIWGMWQIGTLRSGFHIWPVEAEELEHAVANTAIDIPLSAESLPAESLPAESLLAESLLAESLLADWVQAHARSSSAPLLLEDYRVNRRTTGTKEHEDDGQGQVKRRQFPRPLAPHKRASITHVVHHGDEHRARDTES